MGQGFWVLVWDDWGLGLNMINPRLHTTLVLNNPTVKYVEYEAGGKTYRVITSSNRKTYKV